MSTNFLQDSRRDGSLVLHHEYIAGHALDLSGNGNDGTFTAGTLLNSNGIRAITGAGEVSVPHSAELGLSAGTFITILSEGIKTSKSNECLIHKRFGTDVNFYIFLDATPSLRLYDGFASRSFFANFKGRTNIGVSFSDGAIPTVYSSGQFLGNMNGTVSIAPNTVDIALCNYVAAAPLKSRISKALLFNRVLTADEHRKAYLELLR